MLNIWISEICRTKVFGPKLSSGQLFYIENHLCFVGLKYTDWFKIRVSVQKLPVWSFFWRLTQFFWEEKQFIGLV